MTPREWTSRFRTAWLQGREEAYAAKDDRVLQALRRVQPNGLYGITRAAGMRSGTVLPSLARLENAGLVVGEWELPEPVARPARRLYRVADPRRRPYDGACPGCGAGENVWCRDGCGLIDRRDYR